MYVVPAPIAVISPVSVTCATFVSSDVNVLLFDCISALSKLNPLFNLTSNCFVSPIFVNAIYFSFTSNLSLLIDIGNNLVVIVSSPSSPFLFIPY